MCFFTRTSWPAYLQSHRLHTGVYWSNGGCCRAARTIVASLFLDVATCRRPRSRPESSPFFASKQRCSNVSVAFSILRFGPKATSRTSWRQTTSYIPQAWRDTPVDGAPRGLTEARSVTHLTNAFHSGDRSRPKIPLQFQLMNELGIPAAASWTRRLFVSCRSSSGEETSGDRRRNLSISH